MPDTSIPWLALYSLWHRGEAARYKLASAASLPAALAPWKADDAVQRLLVEDTQLASLYRRVGIAQLLRASDAREFEAGRVLSLIQQLSDRELSEESDQQAWQETLAIPEPQERFVAGLRILQPSTALRSLEVSATFCWTSLVSTIQVRAVTAKPLSALIGPSDPRNWHSSFREMWDRSDTIAAQPDFIARDVDPTPSSEGTDYASPFFEEVGWVMPGSLTSMRLGTIRNILNVTRSTSAANAGFTYRLIECLSTEYTFDGSLFQGGIDRDSGYARFSPAAGGANQVAIEVQKSIRFTQPAVLRDLMNQSAFINTLLLLEMLVIIAAS